MRDQYPLKPPGRQPEFGPEAHASIQAMSKLLAQQLRGCSRRELEMLTRYYANGQEEETVLREMGASAEEFARLRLRLRRSAMPETPREPPRAKTAAAG